MPGHSSSYVFTQWGAGKEAKVFTYNLTDDHVDKLKFGPAKDSALTFDFTGLFGQQESPRQSQPKLTQKPKQKSPKPRKNRPGKPKNRPAKKSSPKIKQENPTQRPQRKETTSPNPAQLPRKPKAQAINPFQQKPIQPTVGIKPPRPPGPPPNNIPLPSPVIKGLGNPPIRFGFGPSPL